MNIPAKESKSSPPDLLFLPFGAYHSKSRITRSSAGKEITYSHPQGKSSIFLNAYIITQILIVITMITNVSSSVSSSWSILAEVKISLFCILGGTCQWTVCGTVKHLVWHVVSSNNAVWSSTWRWCRVEVLYGLVLGWAVDWLPHILCFSFL